VAVSHSDDRYWAAKDPATGRLLRWPSERPYFIRFISVKEHELFCACLHLLKVHTFLEHAVDYFSVAPGFRVSRGSTLVAPPDYASIEESEIAPGRILEVPVEFRVS
jgi:hypothetical protein